MSTKQSTPTIGRHEVHKAYKVIFGQDPQGAGLILDRERLARSFRERAYQLRPDRAKELGRSRQELSEALKTVALAFDLLADVAGEQDKVWVMPAVDELDPSTARRWTPRAAPASTKAVGAPVKPSKDVEEATRRIKDAIGKLKAQTEALAKGRAPTPARPRPLPPATPVAKSDRGPATADLVPKALILGRHLHRRGLITLRQLIAAVAWQRAQRPAVGQIAKAWGILDDDAIFKVLQDKDQGELFGDYAVRAGLMTPFQRLAVVGRQRVMQKPLGAYFIEQGILTEEQVETEVEALKTAQSERSSETR